MAGLCKMMIIGNLGRDPEMRYTPNGKAVTTFSVAVNRWRPSAEGERKEETEWFKVVAWSKLAETCNQYLSKGQRVFVEGRFQTRTWTGQDGQPRKDLEIVASDIQMLDRPRTSGYEEGGAPRRETADVGGADEMEPEELPF